MQVLNPTAFWWLLLVIPFIAFKIWQFFHRWQVYLALGGQTDKKSIFKLRFILLSICSILFYIFIVLCYANIYMGTKNIRQENSGLDIVFALDVSRSMLAKDMEGNRLEQAKLYAQKIIYSLPHQVRMAGVMFKGTAVPTIPLTYDSQSIISFINEANDELISSSGSNIASALEASLSFFSNDQSRKQVIILFSDGETLSGQLDSAIRKAKEFHVTVYTIGFGSLEPFLLYDKKGEPIVDRFGWKVESRLEESALKQLANLTHGRYFRADDNNLNELINDLKLFKTSGYRIEKVDHSLYNLFVICALFCLIARLIIRNRAWVKLYGYF